MPAHLKIYVDMPKSMKLHVLKQLNEAAAVAAQELAAYENAVFDTAGEINGEAWKPISERTRKKRAKYGVSPDNPPLHARGILRTRWDAYYLIEVPRIRVGIKFRPVWSVWDEKRWDLVKKHHYGDKYGRYPKRPLFNEEIASEIVREVFERYLAR